VGLVLAAIICLCWPAIGVWRLQIVDYGTKYKALVEYANEMAAKRVKTNGKPLVTQLAIPQGLDQYVGKKAGSSIRKVSGPAWENLFEKTAQSGHDLYLSAETPLLNELYQTHERNVFNLQLPDKYPVFIHVVMDSIASSYLGPEVTWGMTHPLSWLFPWLAAAGLLIYIFLPRPRPKPDHFRYNLVRSQIGLDLLGIFLAGIFLALPLFIVINFSGDPHPLSMDGGKAVLTLICWFVALLSSAMFVISTWYEKLSFQILPNGIRKVNLFGAKEYHFDQMAEMSPAVWRPPAWFRKLSWMMIMFSLGLAAPMILGAQSKAPMVKVRCKDGRILSIMVKHLIGWEKLEQALLDGGVNYKVLQNEKEKSE